MLILRWNPSARHLSISEELLVALDYPHLLIIERDGAELVLYQRGDARTTAKERKVHYAERAMPRMSIGPDPARELELQAGRYEARVDGTRIVARYIGP